MLARGTNDVDKIAGQFIAHHNMGQAVAQDGEIFGLDHRPHSALGEQRFRSVFRHRALRQAEFLSAIGRLHRDLEHEPVFLRFRQRICAFVFNRILRREHREVGRQRMRVAVDGHHPFLHRLQQRRLRFSGRAVDFICQEKRSEDRSFNQRKFAALEVEDVGACNVGGHQIRRELNAGKRATQYVRERTHQPCLGHTGHAFDKGVISGKNRDQGLFDHIVLADDDLSRFVPRRGEYFLQPLVIHLVCF